MVYKLYISREKKVISAQKISFITCIILVKCFHEYINDNSSYMNVFIKNKIMGVRKEKGTIMGQGKRDGKDNRIGIIMGQGQVYDRDRMGKGRAIAGTRLG